MISKDQIKAMNTQQTAAQVSFFNEEADISFTQVWDERRKKYVPVLGSYFDHCEMVRIPDEVGEELLKRFPAPKNFS